MNSSKFSLFRAGALIAVLSGTIYFIYKKLGKEKLNEIIDEYIAELIKEIEQQRGNILSLETITKIFNLITAIEEFLYEKQYKHFDDERIKCFKTENYEDSVMKTIAKHQLCFNEAKRIANMKLNINIDDVYESINSYPNKSYLNEVLEKTKKPYKYSEIFDKETVRKAYLEYTSILLEHNRINTNNIAVCKIKPNYADITKKIFILNKFIAKDSIYIKYGIDEKYFAQLLDKHNLLEDLQLKTRREELKFV